MSDTKEQVRAARESVLVVPAPELGALVVTGGDRLKWLNGLLTCDLAKATAGDAVYGLVVAKNGRIVADVVVVVGPTHTVVVVPAAEAEPLRATLDHHLIMEDAELTVPDDVTVWHAHGPRAADVLAAAREAGGFGGAIDRTGLGGAILVAEGTEAAVGGAIAKRVAEIGGVIGDAAGWEAVRLERAVPVFGAEFDAATYPQEAGLEKTAVSFSKGCYLGQEVVYMLENRGKVKRKIAALVLDSGDVPARGAAVTDASGVAVGEVTSGVASPTLGRAIALAMVKRQASAPGTELRIGGAVAKVVERPVSE